MMSEIKNDKLGAISLTVQLHFNEEAQSQADKGAKRLPVSLAQPLPSSGKVGADQRVTRCPTAVCCRLPSPSLVAPLEAENVICPRCGVLFCPICQKMPHPFMTCKEHQSILKRMESADAIRRLPPMDLGVGGLADAGDGSCKSSAGDGFGGQCGGASAFSLPSTPLGSPAFLRRAGCPPLASPLASPCKVPSLVEQSLPRISSTPRVKDSEAHTNGDVFMTPRSKPSPVGRGLPIAPPMPSVAAPELPGRPHGVTVSTAILGWYLHWKPCVGDPVATKARVDLVVPHQLERRLDVECADDLCAFIPRSAVQDGEGDWHARVCFGNQFGFGPHSELVRLPPLVRSSQTSSKRPLSAPGLSRQPVSMFEKRPAAQEKHAAAPAPPAAPHAPLAAPRGPPPRLPADRHHPTRSSSARQLHRSNTPSGPPDSPRPLRHLQTPPPRERRLVERKHTPPTPPSTPLTPSRPSPAPVPPSRHRGTPRKSRSCPGSPEIKEERDLKIQFLELALASKD